MCSLSLVLACLFRICREFRASLVSLVLDEVLHDERDPAIGGIKRIVDFSQTLIGEART